MCAKYVDKKKITQSPRRLIGGALLMIILGVGGAAYNITQNRLLGAILFLGMTIMGILLLASIANSRRTCLLF